VLAFSAVSLLFLYLLLRVQHYLLLSLGFPNVKPDLAWNTAVSFTTNTNWQAYSGESTMGHLVQMSGLAVQNFVSAAVGIAVAIAVVRGFARSRTDELGNFWVDLIRTCVRIHLRRRRGPARDRWRDPKPPRPGPGEHARGRRPVDHRRAGGQPGGHQGAGHQRRRLLQRQLRPPVREPHQLDELGPAR